MGKVLLVLLLLLLPLTPRALDKEFDCLVRNVYQEARSEPRQGKLAVALVTINRTKSERFPSTICGVVYQKSQFSWTKNYSKVKVNAVQWQQSKDAALEAYMDNNILGNFLATHFHNKTVNPRWKLQHVATIGGHIFYK